MADSPSQDDSPSRDGSTSLDAIRPMPAATDLEEASITETAERPCLDPDAVSAADAPVDQVSSQDLDPSAKDLEEVEPRSEAERDGDGPAGDPDEKVTRLVPDGAQGPDESPDLDESTDLSDVIGSSDREGDGSLDRSDGPDTPGGSCDATTVTSVVDSDAATTVSDTVQTAAAAATRHHPPIVVPPLPDRRAIALPSGAAIARWTGRSGHSHIDDEPERPQVAPRQTTTLRAGAPGAGDAKGKGRQPEKSRVADDDGGRGRGEVEPSDQDRWLMPFFAGVAAVMLLIVFSVGVLMIYRATGSTPQPSKSSSPEAPSQMTHAPSASPSPNLTDLSVGGEPTMERPPVVTVPSVRGMTEGAATQTLIAAGLRVTVSRYEDRTVPPGTVLGTEPAEGANLAPGSLITLIVATAPTPSPSSASPSPSASASVSPTG